MVSHYRIIEKIGASGIGAVYLAEDINLSRQVALKFLPTQLIADKVLQVRFARDAKAAAGLDHPNIVTIYEVSANQERQFFAMQYTPY